MKTVKQVNLNMSEDIMHLSRTILICIIVLILFSITFISCDSDSDDKDERESIDDDNYGDDDFASSNDDYDTTWEDSSSGLMWQKDNEDMLTWNDAITYCNELNSGGYTDWRLPSISELRSLIRGCPDTMTNGSCGITDSCLFFSCGNNGCNGSNPEGGPGIDGSYFPPELEGVGWWYWSSSNAKIADEDSFSAWRINFTDARISVQGYSVAYGARCVR